MQWFIIGRDMHVLCTPSTDLPQTLPIDDSGDSLGQEISITNNSAVGTYDFTTDPRHPDSVYITEGNYIAFRDKYGKDRLYTIMSIEGDEEWTVHCEDIGLDLINEYAVPWDYTARSIEDTLSVVLHDSGWEIGINEVSSYKRATKFEGTTDSQLTRIGDVCNQFDAECEFAIEMKGAKVTKQVINIYKTLGEDKTQQRFIDNINLISLSRSGSIEDLITCIRCYGKEDENGNKLTIADISYDDGRYFSPKGEHRIYDREARNKWSRFRAYDYEGQGEFDGYIVGTFEYDTDDANELLNRGLTELKSRNDVKVTYEASLYDLRADIGDTVQIADNRFQEKVYLSARIQSVRNHYTVSGQDSGVLANYKILTSNPTSQVTQIMEQLKDQIVSVKSTEITYQIGSSGVEPPEGQWVPNPPQTSPGQYLWTRKTTTYTNGSQTTEYSVSRNGDDGKDGEDGKPGPAGQDGRGVRSTSVTYQSSSSGTTIPTGVWSSSIPSVSAGKYLWTRTVIEYTDDTSSTLYSVSKMGGNGTDGKGIKSITEYYLASASSSGVTTSTSGWTTKIQTITTSKKYLWNYEVTRYTDDTSTTTSPCIIGVYGDKGATGNGIQSITNYYLATASGSDVTTDTSGWTTTVQTISAAKKYLWNYEVVTYTNGNQSETALHIIGVYGDQGKPGKDGTDGKDGVDGTDGISMILSNEAVALPCDIEGNPLDYSPATGTAYVYKGASDVSASATWTVSWSGMTGTWTASSRTYKVTGMTADVGKLTIKAVYSGTTLTKVFTVTKALKNIKVNKLSAISANLGEVETGKLTNKYNGKKALVIEENAIEFYNFVKNGEFCGRIRGNNFSPDVGQNTIYVELNYGIEFVGKVPGSPDEYTDMAYLYPDGFAFSVPFYHYGKNMDRVFNNLPDDTQGTIDRLNGRIQAFSASVSISKANTWETQVVKFPKAFEKAPIVIVQAQTGQSGTLVWADGATTTQFTLHKYRPSTTAFGIQIIAVSD
ncbi:phage tail protein [Sellimonas intestinalis]|uniref:phage tail protein n=1 Tax=Sellimonas intestinalis TaxID=1653434 RepID=UPI0015ECCEB6|nr:phage tail protein [Sellimonas intestinalis]MBA2215254.1 phage tail protein [Sellimonas intestinalis]